jgi:hypothetical protein
VQKQTLFKDIDMDNWDFDILPDVVVVTSTFIIHEKMPILEVYHEYSNTEGVIWQFHCGNGVYDQDKMLLVRLDTIIKADGSISNVANLPIGYRALRSSLTSEWSFEKL